MKVFDNRTKKLIAVLTVMMLIAAIGIYFMGGKGGERLPKATLDDLLASTSERTGVNGTIIVPDDDPLFAVAATSAAVYYDENGQINKTPLLVAKDDPGKGVRRFIDAYGGPLIFVGYTGDVGNGPDAAISGSEPNGVSHEMAKAYWSRSDGAMLVEDTDDIDVYNFAVTAAPLASYVNIPIIITEKMDGRTGDLLKDLQVKYTIVIGDLKGYKKVMTFGLTDDIREMTTQFIEHEQGLGGNISYIAMANPLDTVEPEVLDSTSQHFDGELYQHSPLVGPNAWPGTEASVPGMDFELTVPEYEYALVHFTLQFRANDQADMNGERIYVFMYDGDEKDDAGNAAQEAFFGTPAGRIEGDYRIVDFEVPLFNDSGIHNIHVQGREVYEGGPWLGSPVHFDLDVTVDNLKSPIYPLEKDFSSLAPYLAANHMGLVLSEPDFALQHPSYMGCADCGEPTFDDTGMAIANNQSLKVLEKELAVLAALEGVTPEGDAGSLTSDQRNALAEAYYEKEFYVGIIADTNMIPHYYFPGGQISEGMGEPGDIIYADVNIDPSDPMKDLGPGKVDPNFPDLELAVGRITGFDAQDASAVLSRTFFYSSIMDSFSGYDRPGSTVWKENGYVFLGSKIPVETMYPSLVTEMDNMMSKGGFNVKQTSEAQSHREISDTFQEGSNLIVGGVHGFYYWYVPASRTTYGGGSAYDVAHVREMNLGPSTIFLVSCVTGRMDGLRPDNSLAIAYMHSGTNAYIGATRSTTGWITYGSDDDLRLDSEGAVLLGEYFVENLLPDKTVGMALRDGKNSYLAEDSTNGDISAEGSFTVYAHYIIHGDPAFNPYEPVNSG